MEIQKRKQNLTMFVTLKSFLGLHVFRKIEKYKILVCGGDGTVNKTLCLLVSFVPWKVYFIMLPWYSHSVSLFNCPAGHLLSGSHGAHNQVGWVLQCLDNVGQDSQCSNPPCAIVPLGTGLSNHHHHPPHYHQFPLKQCSILSINLIISRQRPCSGLEVGTWL